MVAYQLPPTVSTGTASTAAQWNTYVRDNLSALAQPPLIWAYQTSVQSIPNGAFTQVRWDATNVMRGFTLTSNVIRATLEVATYFIVVNFRFATNATGVRIVQIRSGGVAAHETRWQASTAAGDPTDVSLSGIMAMAISPATQLDIAVWQASGGALNSGGNAFCEVMVWPASR